MLREPSSGRCDETRRDRAVSTVVGAVLIFAIVIVAFSLYQANVVPTQNGDVEWAHVQDVESELVELRNAVIETKLSGRGQLVAVRLGTSYPSRIVALNPPDPGGTLRTTANSTMTVLDGNGNVVDDVCPVDDNTRAIEYSPDYHVLRQPPTYVVEHTVLYRRFENGETVPMTGQKLVEGENIHLIPIKGEYFEGGSGTVSFEPRAGLLVPTTVQDPTIRVTTGLDESDWERLLADEVEPDSVSVTGGELVLDLTGSYTVSCGPVGINQAPPGGERGGTETEINPASPGDVSLVDVTYSGSTVSLTFNNTANTTSFTDGRINFYFSQSGGGGGSPSQADVFAGTDDPNVDDPRATLVTQDDFTTFDPALEIVGTSQTTVILEFDANVNPNDWFVITMKFESGETGLYFIAEVK